MTEWMGRYRPLVAALVHHVNCVSKQGPPQFIYEDIYLTPNEWQVLEYIVEHREDDQHMINMSEALAIPQSSFSKLIEKLCKDGLIERYRLAGNKKNIILKPTPLAVTAYEFHTAELYKKMFQPFLTSWNALPTRNWSDLPTRSMFSPATPSNCGGRRRRKSSA